MPSSSEIGVADLEAGLCASWARQVAISGGGSLSRVGGLLVALSGVPDQTQQVALVERPVLDPVASLVAAEALFAGAGWMPAVDVVAGAHPSVERALVDRGYRVVVARPGMVRTVGGPRRLAPTPHLTITGADAARLGELAAVQSRAFDLEVDVAARLLPPASLGTPGLEVLVALDATSRVVGGLTLHLDGAIAGIVGAAVDPAHQRQGIASALTEVALDRAERAGARTVWLQATDAGIPLWTRHGFVEVGSCEVWLVSHTPHSELRPDPRPTGL